jgi:hypothetical protein
LILIQKKANRPAMMGNFCPIGLLEVLGKVWTKMVTRRILPLLEFHSVLQPNQFASLPGRGTSSKLIQLINVLKEVAENDLSVDLTTADVRGAFDSPERTAQWASWRRIGVPAPLATYLTNLLPAIQIQYQFKFKLQYFYFYFSQHLFSITSWCSFLPFFFTCFCLRGVTHKDFYFLFFM